MSIINTNAKEIHCKILYYGPENSGKKSSILYIKEQFKKEKLDFFKLPFQKELYGLVLSIGKVFGFQTFFHIYNLNNESKQDNKNLLKGTDGVIFVASLDSKEEQKNKDSFLEMENFLKDEDKNIFKFPLVLQYNKKDLQNTLTIKQLRMDLNKYNNRDYASSALTGEFILEPLKYLCKLTLNNLR